MNREDVYLGKCNYVFCDNEAHYTCDNCDGDYCKYHMGNNEFCYECKGEDKK